MHEAHPALFERNRLKPRRKTKLAIPLEAQEQTTLCDYMELHEILFFAIPNDGNRTPAMAAKAARTGLRKGIPDLMIPMARHGYHGLFIEMKRREGGVVSPEQKAWIDALNKQGYKAVVCKGFEPAKRILIEYFEGKFPRAQRGVLLDIPL